VPRSGTTDLLLRERIADMSNDFNNSEYGFRKEGDMTVTLTLEDDAELDCDVVAIFQVQDKDYIALEPMGKETDEVFLYRLKHNDIEDLVLENIEDDKEFELVSNAFDELLDDEWLDDELPD
jgi:uncharacterized protein YrzB (UPF0473 family)